MNHMEQRLQISYPADDLEQALEPEFRSRFARKMFLRASKGRRPSFRRVQSERHLPLTQSFRQSSLFSHNFGSTGSLLCPNLNSDADQLRGKVVMHKKTLRYSIILAYSLHSATFIVVEIRSKRRKILSFHGFPELLKSPD